jgi:hypothetical protein
VNVKVCVWAQVTSRLATFESRGHQSALQNNCVCVFVCMCVCVVCVCVCVCVKAWANSSVNPSFSYLSGCVCDVCVCMYVCLCMRDK